MWREIGLVPQRLSSHTLRMSIYLKQTNKQKNRQDFSLIGNLVSAPTLTYVMFLYNVLPPLKGITSISCLFSLFLILLSIFLLPWFVRFLLWVWVSRPSLSQRTLPILFLLDWQESMRCYLAGHKWILLLWFSFPWGPTISDVLS